MKRKTVVLHAVHYKIKSFTIHDDIEKYFIYIITKLKNIFEKMFYMTAISPYYYVLQFSHYVMQQISCMDMLAAVI